VNKNQVHARGVQGARHVVDDSEETNTMERPPQELCEIVHKYMEEHYRDKHDDYCSCITSSSLYKYENPMSEFLQ